MTNIIRYGTFEEEALDQQADEVNELSGRITCKPEVGENVYRFLPPPLGKRTPFRVTAMHYIDPMPGIERMIVFACPRVELKQPCIACAKAEQMSKDPNPLNRERAKRLEAGLQVYANVVNRRSPEPTIKVLQFGKQIFDQLKTLRKKARLGGDFTDPTDKGFDVVIMREGTGRNDTKYTVVADRTNTPLHPNYEFAQRLIDGQHDLEQLIVPIVPEQLAAIWHEVAGRAPYQPGPVATGAVLPSAWGAQQGWTPPGQAAPAAQQPREYVAAGRAVDDAQEYDAQEYDDDFNPIVK